MIPREPFVHQTFRCPHCGSFHGPGCNCWQLDLLRQELKVKLDLPKLDLLQFDPRPRKDAKKMILTLCLTLTSFVTRGLQRGLHRLERGGVIRFVDDLGHVLRMNDLTLLVNYEDRTGQEPEFAD